MEYAVKSTIFSGYLHQGEICMSTDRVIVGKAIVDEFTDRLVGFVSRLPVGDPGLLPF
jgi:acyl-CoA reductase-like NAD-dependent aldehyde dehydrogenase